MLDFLLNTVWHFIQPFWAPIAAGLGMLIAVAGAYFKGKNDQAQKGKIAVQKETINAYKERDEVDDAVRGTTAAERKRVRDKWTRDN